MQIIKIIFITIIRGIIIISKGNSLNSKTNSIITIILGI